LLPDRIEILLDDTSREERLSEFGVSDYDVRIAGSVVVLSIKRIDETDCL